MKVAIVGSTGYIAGYLLKRFENECCIETILKIGRSDADDVYLNLLEAERFDYSLLEEIDFVVFTAAISEPDKCASDFEFCWTVNVTGSEFFISEAIKRRCRVLFFSSDAVFGDLPGEIYTEDSETKAITPYGRMKKAVEDEFRNESHFKAIRLSYVVSERDRFVSYCLDCISKRKTAEVFHPFYRNCVIVSDVADVVMWFAAHWEEFQEAVLNVAGIELVSRVRIVDELNRHFGNQLRYMISHPDGAFFQNRPKITQMKSVYMGKYHILEEDSFTEKIKKELEGINNGD